MTGWTDARHILAVRLDAMGDVLMTGPGLRALASRGAQVTLLTSPAGAEVARLLPEIADVVVYEAPWVKSTPPRTSAADDHAMIRRLARGAFDGAVIFTVATQSALAAALLCLLAGIPRRAATSRENPYQLLTDRQPEAAEPLAQHEVERQLALAASIGFEVADDRLRVAVPSSSRRQADRLLRRLGLYAGAPLAILHPGASAPSRRYPPDRYAEVASTLARTHGWDVIVTCRAEDASTIATLHALLPPEVRFVEDLPLPTLAALIGRASVFIGNNSGPAHLAAAVGTPSVVAYALTNPQHTPWGVPSRVLSFDVPCRNCLKSICPLGHHACLRGVPAQRLVDAALQLGAEPSAIPA